jgi:hypothetical protein
MGMICKETTFISENGGLKDNDSRRRCLVLRGFGDLVDEGFLEIPLFADDRTYEGVVVFEKGVGLCGAT